MGLLSDAEAELYSADPDTFTARRKELAAAARQAGDAVAAKSIAALGKPTKSAWVVNKLVREDPTVPQRLAELGDQLRAGEAVLDGASIRKLSSSRRELIDSLVKQALGPDAQRQAALREEVTGTLNAALADPEVGRQVAAGTLVKAVTWAGFGPGIGTGFVRPSAPTPAPDKPKPPARSKRAASDPAERARQAIAEATETLTAAARAAEAATTAHGEQQESVRLTEQQLHADQDRLAEAERAATDAQRALAEAQRALADAEQKQADAEQRLATTRQNLAKSRQRLADTSAQVRQAMSIQRKAADAVNRLS